LEKEGKNVCPPSFGTSFLETRENLTPSSDPELKNRKPFKLGE